MHEIFHLNPGFFIALTIALGAVAQWLAWRVNLPAILPLLIIGFLIGPVFGVVAPSDFIGEDLLFPAIGLAVGLILFEGGLTLRLPEVREVRRVVLNLVIVGSLITWLGATAAAYYIVGLDLSLASLFGALVIVTGPTVIGPLIRNVRPTSRIANVLKWEGILIDPVGALVAVLVFEYILLGNRSEALGQTILLFLRFLTVGTVVGVIGGLFLAFLLRRRFIPDYLINFVSLALVFTVFAISNGFAEESGLLATTVMGIIMANRHVPNIEGILSFKEDLTILFISLLFLVLAANIELASFMEALSWQSLALVAVIMLVIRPLNVFASTVRSPLSLREKLFLSWIAPRGIVAAAVTSLFTARLVAAGFEGAGILTSLVFIVIVGTVALNSLTAKPVAQLLGVAEPDPQGLFIMGAHSVARRIAAFLKGEGFSVVVSDTNWSNVATARIEGLEAYYGSPLSERSDDDLRLSGIGNLLALTSNDEANALAALKFAREFGSGHVFQLEPGRSSRARENLSQEQRGRIIFYGGTTYAQLNNLFNKGGELKKTPITAEFSLKDFEEVHGENYLPMFVIRGKRITVVTEESLELEPGAVLVSLVLTPKDTAQRTLTSTP